MPTKKSTAKKPATTAIVPLDRIHSDLTTAGASVMEALRTTAAFLEKPLASQGLAAIVAFLKRIEKVTEAQGKVAVAELKSRLQQENGADVVVATDENTGRVTSRSMVVPFADRTVTAMMTFPRSSKPDDALTEALLKSKNLPLDTGTNMVVSYEADPAKLAILVGKGKLTQAEVDSLYKSGTPTLKVTEGVPA